MWGEEEHPKGEKAHQRQAWAVASVLPGEAGWLRTLAPGAAQSCFCAGRLGPSLMSFFPTPRLGVTAVSPDLSCFSCPSSPVPHVTHTHTQTPPCHCPEAERVPGSPLGAGATISGRFQLHSDTQPHLTALATHWALWQTLGTHRDSRRPWLCLQGAGRDTCQPNTGC